MANIKRMFLSAVMALCLVGTLFVFTACGKSKNNTSLETSNVFAMGMVSAVNYLEQSAQPASRAVVTDATKSTNKQYTEMFEGLLQNGIHPTEGTPSADEKTTYGDYAKKLTISVAGLSYVMYYNEVIEGTETEVDDEEIETETTSFLYGKVVRSDGLSSVTYNVVGSREIESESKKDVTEVESELELIFSESELVASNTKAIDDIDLTSIDEYVLIEQETESDEIEFEYTTKNSNGLKTVEIKFENEKGNEKLEIEIVENGAKNKYEITKVSSNKYAVKVKEDKSKLAFYLENNDGVWEFLDKEGNSL